MTFEQSKKDTLNRLDKSKKGQVDRSILELVNKINSLDDYYTTSSCSGRILLIYIPEEFKKQNVEWIFSSHDKVDIQEIKNDLEESKKDLWFRQEGAILHIVCKNLQAASKMLELAKHTGFKRSGIMSINNKIILELISTELIYLPIKKDNEILVDDKYLKLLIDEANAKMKRTKEKIKRFTSSLKQL